MVASVATTVRFNRLLSKCELFSAEFKAILLRTAESYILVPWNNINNQQKISLINSHKAIIDWIKSDKNRLQTIINDNPITNHYTIADKITANKLNKNSLKKCTIPDLIKMGFSNEQINDLINELRN